MAISTRSDAAAIKKEVTEGTPVVPAAGTDFIAVQEGFSISTTFETLTNAEKTGTIGSSAPEQGKENTAITLEHYARGSGVEGQAPNYGVLLESAFGSTTVVATERNTIAASTTSVLKVDTGEGVEFPRGRPVLVKDPLATHSVRWVSDVATDDLTMNFNLDAAPATGVELGLPVYYLPTNDGHPTTTVWGYKGNVANGVVQMASGCRVGGLTISAAAAEYINASYEMVGLNGFYNPMLVTAARFLDFTSDNGTFAAAINSKWYKDPMDVAEAMTLAMNAADPLETYLVEYNNNTGKFVISSSTSTVLDLLWASGANAANTIGSLLGFDVGADDVGAITYTADNAKDWSAPYTPVFDDASPAVARSNKVTFGDPEDNVCFDVTSISASLTNSIIDIDSFCAETGRSATAISSREDAITLTAFVENYDVKKWHKYHKNSDVGFMWTWGDKDSAGNWIPGKTMSLWIPQAKISEFVLDEQDSILIVNMTLTPYVKNGQGEIYLGQL